MRRVAVLVLSCAALTAVFACRDSDAAKGSEPARIEVKAAVAPVDAGGVVAPIEGHVTHLALADGASVNKGDVVLTLDNPAVDRDLAYARAQARSAELRLHSRPAQRQSSAEGENAAAEILHNKEQKLDRYKKLFAT